MRLVPLIAIMVAVTSMAYIFSAESNLGFAPTVSDNSLKIVLATFAMVLGIISGSLHRQWSERVGPLGWAVVSRAIKSPDLWRSMLLSPILFSGVYVAAKEQPDYVLAFVFAFQSGFFCNKVLEERAT